jgi:hypothetical protein
MALCLFIICLGASSISLINIAPQKSDYLIIDPKITLTGSDGSKDWNAVLDSFNFTAKFITNEGELDNISDFQFTLPVNQIHIDQCKTGGLIKEAILNSNCREIIFSQKNLMILPIMKMVHIIGDIKMMNSIHSVPMQMQYVIDKDQNIKVVAKQFIRLSEFGIILPNVGVGTVEDEMTINIEFTLLKKRAYSYQ